MPSRDLVSVALSIDGKHEMNSLYTHDNDVDINKVGQAQSKRLRIAGLMYKDLGIFVIVCTGTHRVPF